MEYVVAALAALAAILGYLTIRAGDGVWDFSAKDVLDGRLSALLYIAIICTTCWSVLHLMLVLEVVTHPETPEEMTLKYSLLHGCAAIMLVSFHFVLGKFVRNAKANDLLDLRIFRG